MGEAREKLATDRTLLHFFYCHQESFAQKPPGLEVTGASDRRANGCYRRREHAEGPPRGWTNRFVAADWDLWNGDRRWYEKDDDCYMCIYLNRNGQWYMLDTEAEEIYYRTIPREEVAAGP